MRPTNFQAVTMFNMVMGNRVPDYLTIPNEETFKLRMDLIHEEAITELSEAYAAKNLTEVADAIADGLFVLYGAANDFGIDIDIIFSEVVRSNMTKLCDTEADAQYAVEQYLAGNGFHGKTEPINASYRMCTIEGMEDKYVVFNATTGKVLKGPKFEEPKIQALLNMMLEPTATVGEPA